MYLYFKGILIAATPSEVVLEVQGIGYGISIPARFYERLPALGSLLQLHTSFVIREFAQTLYGFPTPQERDLFEIVMQVSGIGPKTALSIAGHLPAAELRRAVMQEELALLCKVPGIGRKTAERLILELKDKLVALGDLRSSEAHQTDSKPIPQGKVQDAVAALIQLGYQQAAAQKAVKQSLQNLSEEADLSSLITLALRHISVG